MKIRGICKILRGIIITVVFLNNGSSIGQAVFPNPEITHTEVHEGDLVLSGDQTMTIEHTHFKVDGSVFLRDHSRLIIRESVIELLGEPGRKRAIWLADSSEMSADTTIFGGLDLVNGIDPSAVESIKPGDILTDNSARLFMNNCFSLLQSFMGNSEVVIRNSYLVEEPLGLVQVEGKADVLIEDSEVGAFFISVPNSVPVIIDSLLPGYLEYWSAKERISDSLTYNLVLRRTKVMENTKGYKGGMEIGWNISLDALQTNVTISNSRLNKLIINYPQDEPANISDLRTRQPISFDLNNIHLINTEIQTQWGIFLNGGPAEIINSEGLFIFMSGGDAGILVFNSEVGEIDPRNYTGTLTYENTTWLGGYEIFDDSHILIRGSVHMLPSVPIFDASSTMTRRYDILLQHDRSGDPFADIPLVLKHQDTIMWRGRTNEEGRTSFDIIFDEKNAGDRWYLSADTSLIHLNKVISILISNPVMINLEAGQDSLVLRSVLHVDGRNNAFPDGTRESPFPSIQEGIDHSGGDLVYVHSGTYHGAIAPGNTRGGIMLKDSVKLMGTGADSTVLAGGVNLEGAHGAAITRFKIEDGIHADSSSLTLRNSVISGFEGTAIWGTKSEFYLINNVIEGNGQDGIFLHDASSAMIRNNIVANNAGFGIRGVETAVAVIDYNNVWNNLENYHEFLPAGPNDLSEDPWFVDEPGGDFHLLSGSPCIDRGDPDPAYHDPDGSRNDIGAYGGPLGSDQLTGIGTDRQIISRGNPVFDSYPNPFSQETVLYFKLTESGRMNLTVYSITGKRIRTLADERMNAGRHQIIWDGCDEKGHRVMKGMVVYRLTTPSKILSLKGIVL